MGRGKGCYIGLFTNNLGGSGMKLNKEWYSQDELHQALNYKEEKSNKKEIAYMKQVHELEKEVERLENIEQELTDLKNHYKSKVF